LCHYRTESSYLTGLIDNPGFSTCLIYGQNELKSEPYQFYFDGVEYALRVAWPARIKREFNETTDWPDLNGAVEHFFPIFPF
jgi:hypothetical protein